MSGGEVGEIERWGACVRAQLSVGALEKGRSRQGDEGKSDVVHCVRGGWTCARPCAHVIVSLSPTFRRARSALVCIDVITNALELKALDLVHLIDLREQCRFKLVQQLRVEWEGACT